MASNAAIGVFDEPLANSSIRDHYEITSDDTQKGAFPDGANSPVVIIPSAYEHAHHGGSHGFDPRAEMVVLQDKHHQGFVAAATNNLPKEVADQVSKRAAELTTANGGNTGLAVRQAFYEYLALQKSDGQVVAHMNTWVSGGRDPFRRPVQLPLARYQLANPKYAPQTQTKRGNMQNHPAAMSWGTSPPGAVPGYPSAPNYGQLPGYAPPAPQPHMNHPSFHQPVNVPHNQMPPGAYPVTTPPAPPAQPIIPPPGEVVKVEVGSFEMITRWHKAFFAQGSMYAEDGTRMELEYLVLIRNHLAQGGDTSNLKSPGPHLPMTVTLASGETRFVRSVVVDYRVGPSQHCVLLLWSLPPTPAVQPVLEPTQTTVDPVANYAGQAAPFEGQPLTIPPDIDAMMGQDVVNAEVAVAPPAS